MTEERSGSLGEALLREKYADEWDGLVEDGERALINVAEEDRTAPAVEVGTRAFLEAAFALGKHTRDVELDADTALLAVRAHVELQAVKSDQEFMTRVSKGDLAATDHLQALHEQAFPSELDRAPTGDSFALPPLPSDDDPNDG